MLIIGKIKNISQLQKSIFNLKISKKKLQKRQIYYRKQNLNSITVLNAVH
ncbi:hypothetical protein WDC_1586 [Paucilactobacillus wasatchensis]|uniref:Uncharacterized protein n=1 Tax=Paucilactobacillus wasatchensis TaxID=1335616 RepID=A0A0D0Y3J8_9LACO|nr:hypothetical protein WDC_1586 [Paucilactobacillus wasatchensis]